MKKGKRLYISLTNNCNTTCPFCSMYSAEGKKTYLTFDKYKEIIDTCQEDYELQIEGGEPFVHPQFWLFLEYGLSTGRCKKVLILTNGILLNERLQKLLIIRSEYPEVEFSIKISVNYWLLKDPEHLNRVKAALHSTKYVPDFSILLNVRERNNDDYTPLLEKEGLLEYSNVYKLQSYGKLSKADKVYEKPVIVQNINQWELFGSTGESFGQDLIARSEAEKLLP